MFYWLCKHILLGPLLRLLFRPQVEGLENVPADGSAILASNHLSFVDSLFLPLVVSRKVTFPAKAEYFTAPGFKGFLSKLFFTAAGQIPIDRGSGSAAKATLETLKGLLKDGDLVGIYPEGTRSPDGRLYRGKTGVARLVLESGAPVVPCALLNTNQIQPLGAKMLKIMRVRIRIGKPLDFSRYAGMERDRLVARSVTDEIMYEIMSMSGQPYVDMYGSKAKALLEKESAAAATEEKTPVTAAA
ncbi:lysophospholipid acyltransferase family protein [Fodinicola feengrottensis]|uniref:Lysophospholipid acyltransferase family protein n=1 Tax=Fodinicola feengrottensis TaxID=435914 RepID=A0ABP4UGX3_9ACTN|nr:lysophospholipid acyltransferase family protein [Fodinicola feengrottensis]